jgi:dihydrolipoamide dehydrogenase
MSDNMNFDVVVIGSGPGGYVAAIRSAQLGMKTAIIEKESLGGVCLNCGCIPTKALLKSAEVYKYSKNASNFGVEISGDIKPNLNNMIERSKGVISKLTGGVAGLMKKNKITVIMGVASFKSKTSLEIATSDSKTILNFKYAVIATGASPRDINGFEADGDKILNYKHALNLREKPSKICIVGSGAIGVEFASFYNSIGCEVVILEGLDKIVPSEDHEVSALMRKKLEEDGINIKTSIKLLSAKKSAKNITISYESEGKTQEITVDKLLMAVGVKPNSSNIGLEAIGLTKDDKGIIKVDGYLKTNIDNIYAIGDVVPGPWLAHKASHEGIISVEKIAEKLVKYNAKDTHPIVRENIPACTYATPQIASIGITENKAKELKKDIKIGKFPLMANGKSIASDKTDGFVKVIFDAKTGEILGTHMIGADVTEMIGSLAIAKQSELTEIDLMHTIFPHPTVSESIHEAVLSAFGRGIHF